MSHAIGAVRFRDGLIMFYEYNGTSDTVIPRLHDTKEGVGTFWRSDDDPLRYGKCECRQFDEPVEIMTTYGYGSWWKGGRACRTCKVITKSAEPWYDDDDEAAMDTDGHPPWTPWPKKDFPMMHDNHNDKKGEGGER